jgi:hypothetical protein
MTEKIEYMADDGGDGGVMETRNPSLWNDLGCGDYPDSGSGLRGLVAGLNGEYGSCASGSGRGMAAEGRLCLGVGR